MLVVKRVHVTYRLSEVEPDQREAVERVLGFHAEKCPVARSISPQIAVTTSVEFV